jgi:Zn-dependent M28 family amino/carboxypeptidase
MSKILLLVSVGFLFNDSGAQSLLNVSSFHPDSLHSIVKVLSADSMQGRFSGSKGCTKAAFFIANEFEKAGLKPVAGNNRFFMPVTSKWVNVVGAIKGKSKPDELIIFSAHYDHIGTTSTNPLPFLGGNAQVKKGDTIYNGSNDDASGVSAVISLAKYFVNLNNNERTLLFVAFAGEELGLAGSDFFASVCTPDSIKAVINIEMIGRKYGNSGRPYMTGSEQSDLYEIFNKQLYKSDALTYKRSFIERDPFPKENLFFRSDNYSFARYGVPAHSIMVTAPTDKYYHSLSDEVSTLDYELMSRIVKAIAIGCRGLVNGTDNPSRINYKK